MGKIRGFEFVKKEMQKLPHIATLLPTSGSEDSAGYDFRTKTDIVILPGEYKKVFSDIKAYMLPDEYLKLFMRSSGPVGLVLKNGTGIVDSDYYENPKNDGNIMLPLLNISNETITIPAGERIVQGVFGKYLKADKGNSTKKRVGGEGSTGKN